MVLITWLRYHARVRKTTHSTAKMMSTAGMPQPGSDSLLHVNPSVFCRKGNNTHSCVAVHVPEVNETGHQPQWNFQSQTALLRAPCLRGPTTTLLIAEPPTWYTALNAYSAIS